MFRNIASLQRGFLVFFWFLARAVSVRDERRLRSQFVSRARVAVLDAEGRFEMREGLGQRGTRLGRPAGGQQGLAPGEIRSP